MLFRRLFPLLLAAFSGLLAADEPKPVDFAREILPILSDKCFLCHGPDARDEDLVRLDSAEAAGADLGGYVAVDADHPEQSELLVRILSEDDPMPPEDFDKKLTTEERGLLSRWVREGGTFSQHWAFVQPQRDVAPTEMRPTEWIDHFVRQRLQDKGIDLAPPAEREVLARRAALVLTGLPPESKQLDAFLADTNPNAFERYVDILLSDPRFGEHQARYWLDAVRYGDTHGLHLDNRRGIYPYRDWVVKAHNENLPLDQFITWQLAGDLLPDPTLEQRVATGFVRMNPSTSEGGAISEEFQAKNSFDRTENFGTVFLGMSFNCARCHTHKYDPITQNEYYRLLAFFNNTSERSMDGNAYVYGDHIKVPADLEAWSEWAEIEDATREVSRLADAEVEDLDLPKNQQQQWQGADGHERLELLSQDQGQLASLPSSALAKVIRRSAEQARSTFTTTLVAKERDQIRPTHLLHRGEYDQPVGSPLVPGTPKVLGGLPQDAPANRLGLALWLTSDDHPLTARVLANQIWQRVFGAGLVRTPEDFGLQGRQPTHPELLDALAVQLQESQWNLKEMLRNLVLSKTFRQSSAWRKDIDDPDNLWLARGPSYRLDAEVLRDIGLWASGLLDPTMGGEGVKPYQPAGMWKALAHPASNTKQYQPDSGSKLYRRSLYVYWKRTSPHPMMTLFDAPSRESSCMRRTPTNTALQSLALMNETQRIEMAKMLAQKLLQLPKEDVSDDSARLDRLFGALACRAPSATERKACTTLLGLMRQRYAKDADAAKTLLAYGESTCDEKLKPVELAAWTQVVATVLASDAAILLY